MQPLIQRAKAAKRPVSLVFPDGTAPQALRAAQILVDEGICTPVMLGPVARIKMRAEENGVRLDGMELQACEGSPQYDEFAKDLFDLRARKGMTYAGARIHLRDRTWFGAMMVRNGFAEGMIAGVHRPYNHTLLPALRVLGTSPGVSRASGVYAMLFQDRKLFFGDCTVNIDPDAETLAEIAINTAKVAQSFGVTPRVAMLSYSDFGEHHTDADVAKVRAAVRIVQGRWPSLQVDGEMQADTAVNYTKIAEDFPFSTLSGPANVLIFPDLQSGNIAYKLLIHLAAAEALGPLVAGIGAPVSVVPLGSTVNDIVNVSTWTVVQALERRSGRQSK
jgi:malate dehydrogenase (oxaloacetate-decarboxylating)(NADP+)